MAERRKMLAGKKNPVSRAQKKTPRQVDQAATGGTLTSASPQSHDGLLTLQRAIGNAAMGRVIGAEVSPSGRRLPPLQRMPFDAAGNPSEPARAVHDTEKSLQSIMDLDNPDVLSTMYHHLKGKPRADLTENEGLAISIIEQKLEKLKEATEETGGDEEEEDAPEGNSEGAKASDIQFASVKEGKVGSIYFPWGRIRLVHPEGPEIGRDIKERFTLSEPDCYLFQKKRSSVQREKPEERWRILAEYIRTLPSVKTAAPNSGPRLVELPITHVSRGGPKAFSLTQKQLDVVVNAVKAKPGNNEYLRKEIRQHYIAKLMNL